VNPKSQAPGFYVLLGLSVLLMGYVCWPFRVPLFLAAVLATGLSPLHARVTKALRGQEEASAGLLTLGVLVVIVAPLTVILSVLVHQAVGGVALVRDTLGISSMSQLQANALPPEARERIDHLLSLVHLNRAQLEPMLAGLGGFAEKTAPLALEASGRALLEAIVMLFGLFFFLVRGRSLLTWLVDVTPLEEMQTQELIDEFRKVSRAALVGTLATALIQGTTSTLGYAFFKLPEPLFFGLLTAVAAFVPVVGTALIWVPAAVWLWLAGSHGAAVGLVVWCMVLVVGAEHIAKPFILKGQVEMHMGLIFLSLLGGIAMFGLIGILAGPVTVAFFLAMTRMYARDVRRQRATPAPMRST
jgi:predicted PurR-regulated permease PerM